MCWLPTVCLKVVAEIRDVVTKAKKVENESFIQDTVRSWCKANKEHSNERFVRVQPCPDLI